MTRSLTIDTEGTLTVDETKGFESLRDAVGGFFDVVTVEVRGRHDEFVPEFVDVWVNDEGKLQRLPKNEAASKIAHHYGAIFADDYIAGTVVVTGGPDGDGETQDLPAHVVAEFVAVLGSDQAPVTVAPTYWEQAAEFVGAGIDVIAVAGPEEFPPPCPKCGGSGYQATAASADGHELERHERSGTRCSACSGTGNETVGTDRFGRVWERTVPAASCPKCFGTGVEATFGGDESPCPACNVSPPGQS